MSEYGRLGRIAVGTPQANPTVEAEFGILLLPGVTLHATRLRSTAPLAEDRLVDYLERVDDSLASYGGFRPDLFAFACTGSSYLVGAGREAKVVAAASAAGVPVLTATGAIRWALDRIGARRIAIVAPYPKPLMVAGGAYWRAAGIEIVESRRIVTRTDDTATIYELSSTDARAALVELDGVDVDAVLLSGTGMPTLSLLANWTGQVPLLSSNACLVAQALDRLGHGAQLDPSLLPTGWRDRLALVLGLGSHQSTWRHCGCPAVWSRVNSI